MGARRQTPASPPDPSIRTPDWDASAFPASCGAAASPPFTAPLSPPRLGFGSDLALLRFRRRRSPLLKWKRIAGSRVESERRQAIDEMRRKLGGDVDHAAFRCIDSDTARVQVEFAADPSGEEGFR